MEHEGHRARMRQRFLKTGLEGFAPHEALELLLFYAIPRRDVNPLAHRLLDTFGSFRNVLEASPQQLMQVEGLGENAAVLIGLLVPFFRSYCAGMEASRPVIANRREAQQYVLALLAGRRSEHFYLIGLDASSRVVGDALICSGDLSEVPAYPRQVVQAALALNAHSVILCHNHPGGNLCPSPADIQTTRQLITALSGIHIPVLDHLIVSGGQCYSLSQAGDVAFVTNPVHLQAAEKRPLAGKRGLYAQIKDPAGP